VYRNQGDFLPSRAQDFSTQEIEIKRQGKRSAGGQGHV